jgi:putative transposase
MHLTHKIKLKPTKEQITELNKASGCARFTYNWALDYYNEQYQQYKNNPQSPKPNILNIKKYFNSIKESQFPWIYESPKDANQHAFVNLQTAFNNFFAGRTKYPTKKKKSNSNKSFYVCNDKFKITTKYIKLPVIGKITTTEPLKFQGKILNCTITENGNNWFACIAVDVGDYHKPRKSNNTIGVDLGLTTFAVTSDNQKFQSPKPLKKYNKKLKRLQRKHSKKQIKSQNRLKSKLKLKKLHHKITNIRHDFLHKLSTKLCSENQTICLENLKTQNMMKNHKLAQSIADASWSTFRTLLTYKEKIYNTSLYIADTFFPSTKLCSRCQYKNTNITLSDRTYVCPKCGLVIDRDLNAAINLSTISQMGLQACGSDASTVNSASNGDEAGIHTKLHFV